MKLYYFSPNNYGTQYFVMAENKRMALQSLVEHITNEKNKYPNDIGFYTDELNRWNKVDLSDPTTFPWDYTLNEYESGEVIQTEIS